MLLALFQLKAAGFFLDQLLDLGIQHQLEPLLLLPLVSGGAERRR